MAVCQYCGRSFCAAHGERLDDGQEICGRSTCQWKKADLERHFLYRDAVAERNGGRRCGAPDCAEAPGAQCSKCKGLFCIRHLTEEDIEERRAQGVVRVRGTLCGHCRRRRGLWSKV
jgi:hypothetical protein